MSKKVSQALEFVTEQTCALLLRSPTPSVSPLKFLGRPFLGFGVRFGERHSLLKQTFFHETEKSLPLCPQTSLGSAGNLCLKLHPKKKWLYVQRKEQGGNQVHQT